jgi:hypothetical protein
MAVSPEDIRKNFEKLQKLADQLGKNFSELNLRPVSEDAAKVRELLAAWQRELIDIEASAESVAASFREVVNSISTQNLGLQVKDDKIVKGFNIRCSSCSFTSIWITPLHVGKESIGSISTCFISS